MDSEEFHNISLNFVVILKEIKKTDWTVN